VQGEPPSRARSSGLANPGQIQLFVNVKFVLNLVYLDFEIVSDFDIRISDFLLSSAFGSAAQYDIRITQYGSIKIERLCKTNPISQNRKWL